MMKQERRPFSERKLDPASIFQSPVTNFQPSFAIVYIFAVWHYAATLSTLVVTFWLLEMFKIASGR
jgi:cell division septal protein FtsQ